MSEKLRVGISHGDINGISYEIILKSLSDDTILEICTPVVFGSAKLVAAARRSLNLNTFNYKQIRSSKDIEDGAINIVNLWPDELNHNPGVSTRDAGTYAMESLEAATEALFNGDIDVLVTAPINKHSMQAAGFKYPGHTEYLESISPEGSKSLMILFDDKLKVALVTSHLPLKEVSAQITKENILSTLERFNSTLKRDFGKERPLIAVLSLNPHCGDEGVLGSEEEKEIIPAIKEASDKGILAFGPYSADGFFGSGNYINFDGVVAMYHDQGLTPFKTLSHEKGVNFTGGLPFVRTSPDHGTAFDIAEKGIADETSMREAIYNAIDIYRRRKNFDEASANPLNKHYEARGADKTIDLTKEESDINL